MISATVYSQKILGKYFNDNLVVSIQKNNIDCFNLIVNNTELKVYNKGNVDIDVGFILCARDNINKFTFKVVGIRKNQKLIDDIKHLIDTNETQIINLDEFLNKSKNSGSASDIEKFARIKSIIATKREICDNLNKILNNAT